MEQPERPMPHVRHRPGGNVAGYRLPGCSWKFHPEISGKMLSSGQIESLLTTDKTGVLKGFHNKKIGKSFEAALKLNTEAKLELEFNR
ncbi:MULTISPECIES: topoisomerase C-terminal repeat-containing protein [Pseudomonas]|uniref:topoisomerase C-terminal repeat-containing protein n=1 Tax=Pseudomonas TaxID=286 RepID=UPI001E348A1F|nr:MULTISPECIES: topoisomerase C-terminal repeat-containing protein [Pseudomonas]